MALKKLFAIGFLVLSGFAAVAQVHKMSMSHDTPDISATEAGQGAFAAISEIVTLLRADPETDWENVDIEALRQHLIDMDNVTLRSTVMVKNIDGGAVFTVVSDVPEVAYSIRRMVLSHAETMNANSDWRNTAETLENGAYLTVTGDPLQIRALGFIGIMTVGMHHQAHHLAIARGIGPHE